MRTDPDRYAAQRRAVGEPVHVPDYVRCFDLDADQMLDWWSHFCIGVRLHRWRYEFDRTVAKKRWQPKENR